MRENEFTKKTILVIDDTPDNLFLVSTLLKGLYVVKVANSGEKALKFLNETLIPPDLILLDIMMPKLDGVKVLKVIRSLEDKKNIQEGKQVKVIMTTALAEKQYVDKTFELGCQAYANKPIDAIKFKEVLEKLALI